MRAIVAIIAPHEIARLPRRHALLSNVWFVNGKQFVQSVNLHAGRDNVAKIIIDVRQHSFFICWQFE